MLATFVVVVATVSLGLVVAGVRFVMNDMQRFEASLQDTEYRAPPAPNVVELNRDWKLLLRALPPDVAARRWRAMGSPEVSGALRRRMRRAERELEFGVSA